MENKNKYFIGYNEEEEENNKKENKIKQIMENNLLTLRKKNNNKKIISKIKDNHISLYSPVEKNYIISYTSCDISNNLKDYYNNLENKNIFLYQSINNNKSEIFSKFNIDKNNFNKFILFHLNYYIESIINNYETNIETMKNFFDCHTIKSLINLLYEYTYQNSGNNNNDKEIIIYNICKILITLTTVSDYYSSLIINSDNDNDNNISLIFLSLKYYNKINQLISSNLLIIIYNCYIDYQIETLNKCNKIIIFILENLSNYQKNPLNNIIQTDFLFNLIEFLSILLNENTFNNYMNNPYINNCILLMINLYQNYDNIYIKHSSIKCMACLLHCIDENNNLKINNFQGVINSLLPNFNIEINENIIVIKTLEIIASFSYLFEIDDFVNNDLINEINQILINFVIHQEQICAYLDNKKINNIFENISIIILNCCFSYKVCNFIIYNTSIIKNIILIIYNYSIDLPILKNFYNFLNEFMDNEDNFMTLVLANFLDIGIIKSLNKYIDLKCYDVILIILNFSYKSLEYGEVFKNINYKNKENYNVNFVQTFFDKKGFNDKLNLIISPDFGDLKCSELAKKIQESYFI